MSSPIWPLTYRVIMHFGLKVDVTLIDKRGSKSETTHDIDPSMHDSPNIAPLHSLLFHHSQHDGLAIDNTEDARRLLSLKIHHTLLASHLRITFAKSEQFRTLPTSNHVYPILTPYPLPNLPPPLHSLPPS